MTPNVAASLYLVSGVLFILALRGLSSPETSRKGNTLGVIGMVLAFYEMASSGGQIDIEMLSKGIYTAMTTTVAGLVVGIIAYIS